jgi:hypothetical protein
MYTPLLAWDMYTLTGAIMSSMFSNKDNELPSGDEILRLANFLLLVRILQAAITAGGVDIPDEMEIDENGCWKADEITAEGLALVKLVFYCRAMVNIKFSVLPQRIIRDTSEFCPQALLAGLGGQSFHTRVPSFLCSEHL